MRRDGIAVPKYQIKDQSDWRGDLVILDVRDDGVNRVIRTARMTDYSYGTKRVEVLYEPHIVWMNEDRFTLAGFERVLNEGKVVEYAQSWLCYVENEATK